MNTAQANAREKVLARLLVLDCGRQGLILQNAGEVRRVMGHGFWLRVPHDGGQPELRRHYPDPSGTYCSDDAVPVPRKFLPELCGSPAGRPRRFPRSAGFGFRSMQLGKLNEEGYPPASQRKGLTGWKCGWRELGLDGDVADWYCFVQ